MSSNNGSSPSPTTTTRPKPTRKGTSRSATPPVFRAALNRRSSTSSTAAPVASTTAEHTYFTPSPSEPLTGVSQSEPRSTEPQVVPEAPSSLQFDPGVTFPASEPNSINPINPIQPEDDMSRERSDSGASTSRRNTMFGNLARPLRRQSTSSDSGSAPALTSLLETQLKDQAARDAAKLRLERTSTDGGNGSDVGSGSEAESNPLAPRRKPKRQNTLTKMMGNIGSVVRRRKASDGDSSAAASATAAVQPEVSQVSPASETSVPTNIVSPIVETSEATSPVAQESAPLPIPVEEKVIVVPAPAEPAVDLGSPPASPTIEVPPFAMQSIGAPETIPDIPNIEESGVLVEPAQADADAASADTRMTPVSSAAAGSGFRKKEEEDPEHHEQDWEQVAASQEVRSQPSFVYTDDGSLADDSASSYMERTRQPGPSVVATLKDQVKARAIAEDEQASTMGTMGDPTEPNERVPPTPYVPGFLPREEFTPPITPNSDKFPELPRGKRAVSKLGAGGPDETTPMLDKGKGPESGAGKSIAGALSNVLPSRDTVDMAGQYAQVPTLEVNRPPQGEATPLSVSTTRGSPARLQGIGLPPSTMARPLTKEEDLDSTLHSPTSRLGSQYISIANTFSMSNPTSPPRTPTQIGAYSAPGIALRHLSTSSRGHSAPASPLHSPQQQHADYSLLEVALFPMTIPLAITRNLISFWLRTCMVGFVFGVTMVRLGIIAITGRVLEWRI